MGFKLFGDPKINDIRVGYISTDRGYVQGIDVCEANSIAKLNPGTTFIIKNRERIEYKNINEVNQLEPKDVFVPASAGGSPEGECEGIQIDKPAGPPKVEFYGGGGVGVKGNPVIGDDGSVMGVHIVSGGHGYQYPPIVKVKDDVSNRGGGVVARARLGETVIKTEVYSAEEEFEEYFPEGKVKDHCTSKTERETVGFGRRYTPDGKDIGPWDPSIYISFKDDPIKKQIADFQEYLATLTDPWWSLRKEDPLRVTSDDESKFVERQRDLNINPNRTVYPVQHQGWGGSLIKNVSEGDVGTVDPVNPSFVEEIFEIYTEGGSGRGLRFTFTETGGDHVFTVNADDYTDSGVPRLLTIKIKPNVNYIVTSEGGQHGGRNTNKQGTEQGLLKQNTSRERLQRIDQIKKGRWVSQSKKNGLGTSSSIFADLIGTNNDADDLEIHAKKGAFKAINKSDRVLPGDRTSYDLNYMMSVPRGSTVASSQDINTLAGETVTKIAPSFMNDHAISPVPMSNAPGSDFAGMLFTMEWEEEFPYPGEYTFKGQCDNEASFYLDGQQEIVKIAKWKDKPSILKKNLDWEDSDKKGKVYKMRIDLTNSLLYKDLIVQQPPQKDSVDVEYEEISTATAKFEGTNLNDIFLVVSGRGTATAEIILGTNDKWSSKGVALTAMKCGDISLTRTKGRKRETLTGTAKFIAGRYKVEIIGADKRAGQPRIADTRIELLDNHKSDTNASITLKVISVKPEKRRIKPPAKPKPAPAAGIKVQKVFNTVEWMNKANRQLWRTNVYSRGGFINAAGVCPFDTNIELDTNPYAGTHEIKWNNVNFPIDGNYIIKVAVDDNANLRFHGPGGDVSIRKEGFAGGVGDTHSTGTSTYTRFFKKGNYTLDVGLEQIPGGRFGFDKDAKGKRIKNKEVSFKVTSAADFANKITIPGLFSVGKQYKGAQLNQNFVKNVEVEKEYDVVCTSEQSSNVRVRVRGGGKRLEMEEWRDGDWQDLVCTVTEGEFYGVQGNRCKFRLGETIKGINPMSLAIDVEVAYATKTVVSAKSWYENPMGVALTIKAPLPPVPVEDKPKQEGRCPNNPMWTTRFPTSGGGGQGASSVDGGLRNSIKEWYRQRWNGRVASEKEVDDWIGTGKSASDIRKGILGHQAIIAGVDDGSGGSKAVSGGQWYPVRSDGWSEFLNRWAISPALPLTTPGTDMGGTVFTNEWNVDIPYDGWYQLKGEVDDIARYYVDGELKLDLSRRRNKVYGVSKFFLTTGLRKLRVEVENYSTITYKQVKKKIFSGRDWRREPPVAPPPLPSGIICHAGGGKGGTDNSEQLQGGKVIVGQGGAGGKGGDDNMYDSHHGGTGGGAGLRSGGSANNPLTHSQIDSMSAGRYKGGPGGFGVNFSGSAVGSIQQTLSSEESSGGNGVVMGGGGGGNCRGGKGGSGGNGGVKITWGLTGKSQEWTTPGNYEVIVPGNIGKAKKSNAVPVTAKFVNYGWSPRAEEMNKDVGIFLEVSGTGKAECTIKLQTNDKWSSKGVALTAMKCGSISLTRTKGERSETLSGTGTFVGGKRYKVEIIGADRNAGDPRVADTRIELLDRHKSDTNASLNLSVSSQPQPMDGVTIVCIGGGGSGFMDGGGDKQGSGGSGGAYAWVNRDIEAGKKLKVVVGKGGTGKNVQGGENGNDSYVEIVATPPPPNETKIIEQQKGKVTYKGPNLFHFIDKRWGKVMNKFSVSPANVDANLDHPTPDNVGTKTLEWTNVDFPAKGQYEVLFVADNKARLFINNQELLFANENFRLGSDNFYDNINIGEPGRYDIKIELSNTFHGNLPTMGPGDDIFRNNPCGVVLEIRKEVNVATDTGKSWSENPMGVSGILVPPPCPKEVGGKGVVDDVVIDDPGNGFPKPPLSQEEIQYPVKLVPKEAKVMKKGINYDCAKDKIIMEPDKGYKLIPKCGPFGTIEEVVIVPPPDQPDPPGFTDTPDIRVSSATGINADIRMLFDIVVVPPITPTLPDIIQVTDLAGIKKTGYYDGKPYYGAVFYQDGIKYAGWYATAGQPIQIYDTLQESIDATITTPPSAIQRQGSDVTSNDPRLNIPGTPENLT